MRKTSLRDSQIGNRVGFIVVNVAEVAESTWLSTYNTRDACEQWIEEGEGASDWTRRVMQLPVAGAARLQLYALAFNVGEFL